jgi:hypothetical protein
MLKLPMTPPVGVSLTLRGPKAWCLWYCKRDNGTAAGPPREMVQVDRSGSTTPKDAQSMLFKGSGLLPDEGGWLD